MPVPSIMIALGHHQGSGAQDDEEAEKVAAFKALRAALTSKDDEAGLSAFLALCDYHKAEAESDDESAGQ